MNKNNKEDKILSSEILEDLKNIREEKEYSIEEIAEKINIKASYIKAIEEGDISRLPGGVYNKAYIKSYSEFLGKKIPELNNNINISKAAESTKVKVEFGKDKSKVKPNILIIILCMLLITLLYGYYFKNNEDKKAIYKKYNDEKTSPIKLEKKALKNSKITRSIIANYAIEVEFYDIAGKKLFEKKLEKNEAFITSNQEISFFQVEDIKALNFFINGIPIVEENITADKENGLYYFTEKVLFDARSIEKVKNENSIVEKINLNNDTKDKKKNNP